MLSEALIIGTTGGVFGWLLGSLGAVFLNWLLSTMALRAGAEPISLFYTPWMFGLGIAAFSIFVGFFTGWYPARRAVKINPLDALRYE